MDIQKAYDTLEWDAFKSILMELGFPKQFTRWTMLCIETMSYRYSMNGSPMLFVMVMEYLHRVVKELNNIPDFNFHPKCEQLEITNLCFADDLLLFTKGDQKIVALIMDKVNKFSNSTCLKASHAKYKVYLGGVDKQTQKSILHATGFTMGSLPFKYLGVPLASKKLTVDLCSP
ncbi:PREDICTED: uncharacterized protein LOC109325965 [Lupinus angustifolius]|uniref:uncharacterized protein LOC109325965 n=1 Tax=Lupinus angustifolius TaxID=3871 RepID=UPI00092E96C8|nr:PREDICTED: uncharacterized protein LOC109325965 [Lupinus angustifolius]